MALNRWLNTEYLNMRYIYVYHIITTHAISLYNQLCKAAPLHSEMRNKDLQKWVECETMRGASFRLASESFPSSWIHVSPPSPDEIPTQDHSVLTCSLVQKEKVTVPSLSFENQSSRPMIPVQLPCPRLFAAYFTHSCIFFSPPCLGQRGLL